MTMVETVTEQTFNTKTETLRRQVDERLEALLDAMTGAPDTLKSAMGYSLLAGGKRIRPLLCLLTHEMYAEPSNPCLVAAACLEMLHTYTLIHDDLPSMDDDDLRRGKPTLHRVYPEGIAVLAGDALLTECFRLLAEALQATPDRGLAAIRELAGQAGACGVIAGQVLDLESDNQAISEEHLIRIHWHKTGKLMTAAITVGALIAGAPKPEVEILSLCGREIGLAFQILDDILDETGDEAILGKNSGTDARHRKPTYPRMFGLDLSRRRLDEHIKESLRLLDTFGSRAAWLKQMVHYLAHRKY